MEGLTTEEVTSVAGEVGYFHFNSARFKRIRLVRA
jgi:hypothetical protein